MKMKKKMNKFVQIIFKLINIYILISIRLLMIVYQEKLFNKLENNKMNLIMMNYQLLVKKMCKNIKIFSIFNKYLYFRDLQSIERINKIKKNRTEDSDEEDLNADEDNYEDEEISV